MRRKISTIFLVGLGCCVALIGTGIALVWGPASRQVTHTEMGRLAFPPAVREAPSAQQDIEAIHTEIARLKTSTGTWEQHAATMQRELTALQSRLTQVDKGQTALAQAVERMRKQVLAARPDLPSVSKRDTAAVSHSPSDWDTAAASLSPEEEIARADAQLQTQIETLESAVYEEKPDPVWSRNAEQALHAMWQGQENLGLSLVHAECRTSLCRLELDLDGTRDSEESFHTLIHYMPWSGQRFVHITEGEAPQVMMYLAREGYELPQE